MASRLEAGVDTRRHVTILRHGTFIPLSGAANSVIVHRHVRT